MSYSVIMPSVVIRPTLFPLISTNHRLPSGPAVIAIGSLYGVGTVNSVRVPPVFICPFLFAACASENQRLPSGPAAIDPGALPAGTGYSVMVPAAASTSRPAPGMSGAATVMASAATIPHRRVVPIAPPLDDAPPTHSAPWAIG